MNTESKTPFLDAVHAIEEQQEDAKIALRNLLESKGWTWTSNTPMAYWMFEKKMEDDRTLLCDAETALRYEVEVCEERYEESECG